MQESFCLSIIPRILIGFRDDAARWHPADRIGAADQIRAARKTIANERQVGKQLGLNL